MDEHSSLLLNTGVCVRLSFRVNELKCVCAEIIFVTLEAHNAQMEN